jgi:cardiolipin-specific phospholipase
MTSQEATDYFICALEEWRKNTGITEFLLAGHSFGGYIATLYFEKYSSRVKKLLLLSPAGTAKST